MERLHSLYETTSGYVDESSREMMVHWALEFVGLDRVVSEKDLARLASICAVTASGREEAKQFIAGELTATRAAEALKRATRERWQERIRRAVEKLVRYEPANPHAARALEALRRGVRGVKGLQAMLLLAPFDPAQPATSSTHDREPLPRAPEARFFWGPHEHADLMAARELLSWGGDDPSAATLLHCMPNPLAHPELNEAAMQSHLEKGAPQRPAVALAR